MGVWDRRSRTSLRVRCASSRCLKKEPWGNQGSFRSKLRLTGIALAERIADQPPALADMCATRNSDLRREPIEVRKATLASILRKSGPGVRLNEYLEHPDGLTVFQHACKMGLEGIVSKRLGSRYRSGRSPDWVKFRKS